MFSAATVTLTNALDDTNYNVVCMISNSNYTPSNATIQNKTTSTFDILLLDPGGVDFITNSDQIYFVVYGRIGG